MAYRRKAAASKLPNRVTTAERVPNGVDAVVVKVQCSIGDGRASLLLMTEDRSSVFFVTMSPQEVLERLDAWLGADWLRGYCAAYVDGANVVLVAPVPAAHAEEIDW